jgi:hypothetical protein
MEPVNNNPGSTPEAVPELPFTDDPKFLMDSFRQSLQYTESYNERWAKLKPSPETTEEEKRQIFEQTESAKGALIDFSKSNLKFKYNPQKYDPETHEAIETYIWTVNGLIKAVSSPTGDREMDKDIILSADQYRSVKHTELARMFVKNGFTSTVELGRVLARLILIDKGLDNFENASISDEERLRRMLRG